MTILWWHWLVLGLILVALEMAARAAGPFVVSARSVDGGNTMEATALTLGAC